MTTTHHRDAPSAEQAGADCVATRFIRALAPKMSPMELWLFDLGPAPLDLEKEPK